VSWTIQQKTRKAKKAPGRARTSLAAKAFPVSGGETGRPVANNPPVPASAEKPVPPSAPAPTAHGRSSRTEEALEDVINDVSMFAINGKGGGAAPQIRSGAGDKSTPTKHRSEDFVANYRLKKQQQLVTGSPGTRFKGGVGGVGVGARGAGSGSGSGFGFLQQQPAAPTQAWPKGGSGAAARSGGNPSSIMKPRTGFGGDSLW
jgi:hypothetical protein